MSEKYSIFEIQGGIGKQVAATGMLDAYKNDFPERDIIVTSPWPEVYIGNPDVYRVYLLGSTPYFYEDYILDKDVEIFCQEPYKQTQHILKHTRLIETWCDLVGATYTNNQPKLTINSAEMAAGAMQADKPILIFQPFGGPGKDHQSMPYSWMRDLTPGIAQEMVNIFSQKYHVVHVCYDFHPQLQNCQRYDQLVPKKILFAMLKYSTKRVLIDSCLQHAAAALGLESDVFWIATQPKVFGYSTHKNHTPKEPVGSGTIDSYLHDYNFTGAPHECPFENPDKMFDYTKIVTDIMA